jgi:hypothetical protein
MSDIAILKKQNDGIIAALKAKNVAFEYEAIDETDLEKVKALNVFLKDLSAKNRPPPQPKAEQKPRTETKPKTETKPNDEEDDDNALTKEVKPVFQTITNMEDIKRAFFSKDYEQAATLINSHPFQFYKADYKYADDNTGKPDYAARNLLRGFVQGLDDYRRYLLACFRCVLTDLEAKKYDYPSYWIVNTPEDLKVLLGELYDDYVFTPVITKESFLKEMEKQADTDDQNIVGEAYLH